MVDRMQQLRATVEPEVRRLHAAGLDTFELSKELGRKFPAVPPSLLWPVQSDIESAIQREEEENFLFGTIDAHTMKPKGALNRR